jgi:uncharacterized protein (TIGR03083 family)
VRPPSPQDARDGTVAQFALVAAAVVQLDDGAFGTPTRLPGWTVAELVAHLCRNVESVAHRLDEPPPARTDADVFGYLLKMRDFAPKVAQRAVEAAHGATPAGLRHRLAAAVADATTALDGADLDRPVTKALGTISLGDFLVTRCVEGVVHGLDLGGVEPDATALKVVVRTFAGLLEHVAPGRSVEVRIPGHVAVQCVEGPRHTRGTPPNVVEADAVTFTELAAGRLRWDEARSAGRVSASGERADLSAYLPLIG